MKKLSLMILILICISCVDYNDPSFHPRNEYNEWLAKQSAQGDFDTLVASFDAKRAKEQFYLCTSCHGAQGHGNLELKTPCISGLPEWYIYAQLTKFGTSARGGHPHDEPGLRMAPMSRMLSPKDRAHVARFVSQLPTAHHSEKTILDGDLARGKDLYAVCAACHGADGNGIQAMNAPPLKHTQDWYLVAQLKNFKQGVRASDPARDPIGASMAPMANTLKDDQAIHDVVSYITSLE